MTAARHLHILSLGVLTVIWLGVGGEALSRFEDNWRFDRLTLTKAPPDPAKARDAERALLAQVTYQAGVDPEWFFLPPARLEMPRIPELESRHQANPRQLDAENYIWNSAFLARPSSRLLEVARELQLKRVFVLTFESEFFGRHGFIEIEGTPVTAEVFDEMCRSYDIGVAEFLDLSYVKPNILGNSRMLRVL